MKTNTQTLKQLGRDASQPKAPQSLGLGVYLTPESHHVVESPKGQYRLGNILTRVNNKFANAFGLSFDYSVAPIERVATLPELAKRGIEVKCNNNVISLEEIGEFTEWYNNELVCNRVLMDHERYFLDKGTEGHKLILTNVNGFDRYGNYSGGCADHTTKTCVANLYGKSDFQRYIFILHELSHLFGAKHGGIPFNVMSPEKQRDFWGPFTKRKIRKGIKKALEEEGK